ncbi:MAG TPA: mercuric transporter MerT family protein [Burkholderiales bacterium]|nr:mercuric transporter MerT family protein [Burkholderiales bacterium]
MTHDPSASLAARAAPDARAAPPEPSAAVPLAAGGLASVLASVCCVGPLALVLAGVGGAWVGTLQAFAPYQPFFLAAAAVALAFAWRRIHRPVTACAPGEVCAVPSVRRGQKIAFWLVALLVLVSGASPYFAPLFY